MNGLLNLASQALAYTDASETSAPVFKNFDWKRVNNALSVVNPTSVPYVIEPGGSKLVFDGTRATAIDGTSAFSLTNLSLDDYTRYRITHTGGTAPAFRTDRALTLSGTAVTFTVQNNASVVITVGAGTPFGAVQVGDTVFIPHTTTGDSANVLSADNAGYWEVLAASSSSLTLVRPEEEDFQAANETRTLTDNAQFVAFSAAGVQVGDKVRISAGFASKARKTHTVVAVHPKWIEFNSTVALANETGILPTASGMTFYTAAKRWVRIEADQGCVVRANGDTGNTQEIEPWSAGDILGQPGGYEKTGPMWSLTLVNLATVPVNVIVMSVE